MLALQGAVHEHLESLQLLGIKAIKVRRPRELADVDALVMPGGESTAIVRLAARAALLVPLAQRVAAGMPVYGACAGMVLLADEVIDGEAGQQTVGGLRVAVRRNAFGRQLASFEGPVQMAGVGSVRGVFIRAPWVERVGAGVDVLATLESGPAAGRIVAVRQGPLLATSFHPELTGDPRVHALFVDLVKEYA